MADSSVESLTQDCYRMLAECVRTVNTFPTGAARDLYSTYTGFNVIVDHLSENVLAIANNILASQGIRETLKKGEECMNILEKANDDIIDGKISNLTIQSRNELAPGCIMTALNQTPKINHLTWAPTSGLKPQTKFNIHVDNSPDTVWKPSLINKPHSLRPYTQDNSIINAEGKIIGYVNPYEQEIESYDICPSWLQPNTTVEKRELEQTPYKYIDTEAELDDLCQHLMSVKEIALDVEHHSFRSYLGLTCLLQISTETGGDFIIDALKLREKLQCLNTSFADPKIKKIAHGGQNDVLWLQRDCKLYIVGLFDTYEAAKVLKYEGKKLSDLATTFCGVNLDKSFQKADWSVRPLPEAQLAYARMDTHFLIYIAARLTDELFNMGPDRSKLLEVYNNSRSVCKQTFMKPVIDDKSYMDVCPRESMTPQSLLAVQRLFLWRDQCARAEDESVTYILPTNKLIKLAQELPRDIQGLNGCCGRIMSPIVKRDIEIIHKILLECRNNLPVRRQNIQVHITYSDTDTYWEPHNAMHKNKSFSGLSTAIIGRTDVHRSMPFRCPSSNDSVPLSNRTTVYFLAPFIRYEEFGSTIQ